MHISSAQVDDVDTCDATFTTASKFKQYGMFQFMSIDAHVTTGYSGGNSW
jgi:hypothetical protein